MNVATRISALMLLTTALGLGGCANETSGEPDETTAEDEQKIYYGQSAAANLAVVELWRNGGSWCTGVLISARHILTAAHCTDSYYGAQWYQIRAKTGYSTFANIRDSARSDNWILATETHNPSFNFSSPVANYDIAVLTLPTSVNTSAHPKHRISTLNPYVGQSLGIWGWGRSVPGASTPSGDLLTGYGGQQVTTSSVEWNGYATKITAVVNNYARTCAGDSGGALTAYRNGNYMLMGIHRGSSVPGCATDGSTMYWSGVADKINWIRNIVSGSGIYCYTYADHMKCF